MLHTIATNHIDVDLITENDAVLFWQNGVIFALKNNSMLQTVLTKTVHCYVLNNDLLARGLTAMVDNRVKIIEMQGVVSLTEQFYPQINH